MLGEWRVEQVHSEVTKEYQNYQINIFILNSSIIVNDKIITYNSSSNMIFFIKGNIRVILEIALLSTNQRPVFINCSEKFQTILII